MKKTATKKETKEVKAKAAKPAKVEADKPRRKTIKIQHYDPPKVTFLDKAIQGQFLTEPKLGENGEPMVEEFKAEIGKILDDHIDAWHADPQATNLLHEYLGLNDKEYKKLLGDPEYLTKLVESHKKKSAKKKK